MPPAGKIRLAFVVSHPIQYYVPLYRRLAGREDVEIKVFFTWHGGEQATLDRGFQKAVAWDIPLTDGYSFDVVPNTAREPGTHHFRGLQNPALIPTVLAWKPDAVHLTGYAYQSHIGALREFAKLGVPVLFRGDSHLLNQTGGLGWWIKCALLRRVYGWAAACLYVGEHNRAYYRRFGVPDERLFFCPHSIEVQRFAEPRAELEQQAQAWRGELGIDGQKTVLLFAGKFEDKKRPAALMRAMKEIADPNLLLVMVGDGHLRDEVRREASSAPGRFRVLTFQNQSRMPLVYRLGDVLVLPSAYGETWGLAVNEAMACGRAALVSNKVGCAPDLVRPGITGEQFPADDWPAFRAAVGRLTADRRALRAMGERARAEADKFDIPATEEYLMAAVTHVTRALRKN